MAIDFAACVLNWTASMEPSVPDFPGALPRHSRTNGSLTVLSNANRSIGVAELGGGGLHIASNLSEAWFVAAIFRTRSIQPSVTPRDLSVSTGLERAARCACCAVSARMMASVNMVSLYFDMSVLIRHRASSDTDVVHRGVVVGQNSRRESVLLTVVAGRSSMCNVCLLYACHGFFLLLVR